MRFDIPLLGHRVVAITDWIGRQAAFKNLGLGYFGASTGAAAALVAAAERPKIVKAVVSRGGRPDLAGPSLKGVLAPTLFIVGGDDPAAHYWRGESHPTSCAKSRNPLPRLVVAKHNIGIIPRLTKSVVMYFMTRMPGEMLMKLLALKDFVLLKCLRHCCHFPDVRTQFGHRCSEDHVIFIAKSHKLMGGEKGRSGLTSEVFEIDPRNSHFRSIYLDSGKEVAGNLAGFHFDGPEICK